MLLIDEKPVGLPIGFFIAPVLMILITWSKMLPALGLQLDYIS